MNTMKKRSPQSSRSSRQKYEADSWSCEASVGHGRSIWFLMKKTVIPGRFLRQVEEASIKSAFFEFLFSASSKDQRILAKALNGAFSRSLREKGKRRELKEYQSAMRNFWADGSLGNQKRLRDSIKRIFDCLGFSRKKGAK
jgi:hypothetical protein